MPEILTDIPDEPPRNCGNCRHHTYDSTVAHQTRCKRFSGADGTTGVCHLLRLAEGKCGGLEGWEPA